MGMFRSVEMDLSCERCGDNYRAEVQFKTEHDWCQVYTIGHFVEDLPVGEEWEGIADRLCRSCQENHRAEREVAMATVTAVMVRAGKLVLRSADVSTPMTADEIVARGEEKGRVAREALTLYGLSLLLSDLLFLNHDGTWLPTTRLRDSSWASLSQALDKEMRRLGWPSGDDLFRDDLMVYLDEERRVQVRLA